MSVFCIIEKSSEEERDILYKDGNYIKCLKPREYFLNPLEKEEDYGVAFTFAGLKDIILPGDIKEILNTVLIAEKQAQQMLLQEEKKQLLHAVCSILLN